MNGRRSHRQHGFTLIEAIMVITITGIIAAVVAVFVRKPVEGYFDTARRAELTDAADVALRRISREVRLALPNSLRVMSSGGITYIEFIATSTGGRYRDTVDGSSGAGADFLDFYSTSDVSFHVLGKTANTAGSPDFIAAGDQIVIHNLGPGYAPGDAYSGGNMANVDSVSCVSSPCTVTLTSNTFAAQSTKLPSPGARFQVLPGSKPAVTFACPTTVAGALTRHWDYTLNASQTVPSGDKNAILAGGVTCTVEYTTNATGRNGILIIKLTLSDTSGESVTLYDQIRVDNSP